MTRKQYKDSASIASMVGDKSPKKRRISKAGRAAISKAQKARWAKHKEVHVHPDDKVILHLDHKPMVNAKYLGVDAKYIGTLGKHVSESGATSSEKRPHYGDIPYSFMKRLALRFTLGAEHHGRGNWMRAYSPVASDEDETTGIILGHRCDVDFLRDRYNHAVDHLMRLYEGTKHDDHIGAVGWFLAFASQAEELGVDWKEVLQIRTPEQDQDYKFKYGLKK